MVFLMADSAGSSALNVNTSAGFSREWINFDTETSVAYPEEVLYM